MAQTYLNRKQELFCQFLARGCTQLDAYTNAGYEPSSANASTLAAKQLVKDRVEELRNIYEAEELELEVKRREAAGNPVKLIEAAEWTFQRVMDMMAENVKLAQIASEYKAANETLKMMGEAMKMFEKAATEAKTPRGGLPAPSQLTLIGKVTQMMGEAAEEPAENPLAPRR